MRIPLWFFRDLGILEDEIVRDRDGLRDLNRGRRLPLRRGADKRTWLVGDLEYEIEGGVLDLGVFARQPVLWVGNPSLTAFSPCKEGWDLPLEPATGRLSLPRRRARTYAPADVVAPPKLGDAGLARLHTVLSGLLFSPDPQPDSALAEVERVFYESPLRTEELVRARLRALAFHPSERLRCWAYRILLIHDPDIDYGEVMPAFVRSGLPFLNRESIDEIASTRFGRSRLDAFRVRLRAYRETMRWPVDEPYRRQFERIFSLLVDLAGREPSYFSSVRAELASWVLHRSDPELARTAERAVDRMIRSYGKTARDRRPGPDGPAARRTRAPLPVCDDSLTAAEARRVRAVLALPSFLRDSVRLACGVEDFDPGEIAPDGLWVSRIYSAPRRTTYRISVNTTAGRHYDLKLILPDGHREAREHETRLWAATLSDQPGGPQILTPLGATDQRTGAVTWRHLGDLTVWEKIRQFAGWRAVDGPLPAPMVWRKLYVGAMAALFRAWQTSGRRILPGRISPVNVVVPDLEYRDDTFLASIDGWQASSGPLSLVRPMVDGFYRRPTANYPWLKDHLDLDWIFDAAYDALGRERASALFAALLAELERTPVPSLPGADLAAKLGRYRAEFDRTYSFPMPAQIAVETYRNGARRIRWRSRWTGSARSSTSIACTRSNAIRRSSATTCTGTPISPAGANGSKPSSTGSWPAWGRPSTNRPSSRSSSRTCSRPCATGETAWSSAGWSSRRSRPTGAWTSGPKATRATGGWSCSPSSKTGPGVPTPSPRPWTRPRSARPTGCFSKRTTPRSFPSRTATSSSKTPRRGSSAACATGCCRTGWPGSTSSP